MCTKPFYVGIDPGVTRTGVTILGKNKELIAGATFHSDSKKYGGYSHIQRVTGLALEIAVWVEEIVSKKGDCTRPRPRVLGIETPIMNSRNNPSTFSLQWRLYQALIDVGWDYIVEISPASLKICGAGMGNATKKDILAWSPYADNFHGFSEENLFALADSWAAAVGACDMWKVLSFEPKMTLVKNFAHPGPVVELIK